MTTRDRFPRYVLSIVALAAVLPAQKGADPGELPLLYEQLQVARQKGDQPAAVAVLERLCVQQPVNPACLLALAETHASLGPAFEPRRTAMLCERFLALTDPASAGGAAPPPSDQILAGLTALGMPHPPDGVRSLRVRARQLLEQQKHDPPERLLLWPDRTALARKVTVLTAEQDRISRDRTTATRSLAAAKERTKAAEADYARARRAAAANQFVDTTELWTRVLDRREEVKTMQRRCDRLGRELTETHAELQRHETRLRVFEPGRKPTGR